MITKGHWESLFFYEKRVFLNVDQINVPDIKQED